MTAIQAVYIKGYEERTSPKPHTVYRIEIQANVRSWQMWRRYSEFDDLHAELTKAAGSPPPLPLPPKHKFSIFRSHADQNLLEERKVALENFLRAILSAKDDKWREQFAFREFLGIPVGRQGSLQVAAPSQFTASSWLDEHLEMQAQIRDVRADINKRDALADQGDIGASHKSNVSAKTKLAAVLARIGSLAEGLKELSMGGMVQGELQRRTDMVARLQDDCEKLGKMVTIARQASRVARYTNPSAAPESDREMLLGSKVTKGGSLKSARVFGAPPPPVETEQTRPLDDIGLHSLQQVQVQQQDQQLSQLTTILQRQRQLGEAIGNEIQLQIEMLDDLSNDVDRVGGKLGGANKQLRRLG
ncbi:syntaxin [Pluteus cervinus]|uniref:Syntaxin n=1 Tax=Pluteus cervinus TaxID=181527 RepID=A0ACD3BG85_9AGAR|nr:syntaxin [Pluteus cervinus]